MLARALRSARWRKLLANNIRFNALVRLLFGITVLWQLSAGIRSGFNFHLVGATLFLFMFGWPIALIATTLVLLVLSRYTWPEIQYHYLIPAPILILAESFATGAMISAFTVSQQEAVKNFSEQEYLTGK